MKLLSRDEFRTAVFERDGYKCVICGEPAMVDITKNIQHPNPINLDAHHIIERRLFTEPSEFGGYFLDNGATLCRTHHIMAEETTLGCDEIREACKITDLYLPDHFYFDIEYDKWGNIINPNGTRLKGDLFFDESVQKILAQGDVLNLFSKYWKYPRTFHSKWSKLGKDDRMISDISRFEGNRVISTLKMDGENCLDGDTIVITIDGEMTIREICENKYFGLILSKDIENNKIELQEIMNHRVIDCDDSDNWYEIELENGKILRLTSEHYVYCKNIKAYRRVCDLNIDDEIDFLL